VSFKAGVQYGDFGGTSAADRADDQDLGAYLRSNGLMRDNEFLIAIELWIGENHRGAVAKPSIRALVVDAPDYDGALRAALKQDPVRVRVIELELALEEFLGFFKRFAVTLTVRGADLEGKDYQVS
jgi:hypothetical protein